VEQCARVGQGGRRRTVEASCSERQGNRRGVYGWEPSRAHNVADLVITTVDGRVGSPDRWLPFLSRELREADGFVTVQRGNNSYAQVFNDRGTLLLEYRDGSPQRHFQTAGVGLAAAAQALQEWANDERQFVQNHDWVRLTTWDVEPTKDTTAADS